MPTTARALGRLFDVVAGILPVNLNTGANTGFRVHMKNYAGCTICVFASIGTAASDLALDLQEANAATGGTIQDLDIVTDYYIKDALALTATSAWVKTTQAAASEITDAGGTGVSAEHSQIVCIDVSADQLSDGFEWLSINAPQPGATKLGCALFIMWGLKVQRTPANLVNPNA